MFSVTINGNSLEELYFNLEAMLKGKQGAPEQAPAAPVNPIMTPAPAALPPVASPTVPAGTTAPAVPPTAPMTAPTATAPIAGTLDQAPPVNPTVATETPVPTFAPTATNTASPSNSSPGVPLAAPPTYTLDQLARAGASLAQSGKMEQALALLAKYNVQTVNQLSPDQYGAFATELRALGAQL